MTDIPRSITIVSFLSLKETQPISQNIGDAFLYDSKYRENFIELCAYSSKRPFKWSAPILLQWRWENETQGGYVAVTMKAIGRVPH